MQHGAAGDVAGESVRTASTSPTWVPLAVVIALAFVKVSVARRSSPPFTTIVLAAFSVTLPVPPPEKSATPVPAVVMAPAVPVVAPLSVRMLEMLEERFALGPVAWPIVSTMPAPV